MGQDHEEDLQNGGQTVLNLTVVKEALTPWVKLLAWQGNG